MSMAVGHFAVGASASLVVLDVLPPRIRNKIPGNWFAVILSGLWAMIPDVDKLSSHFNAFHESIWANFFFLHQVIDRLDKSDSDWVSAVMCMIMAILALIMWIQDFWYHLERKN